MNNTGWFPDEDEDAPGPFRWRPYLQIPGMIFALEDTWFPTEDACLEFITKDILGAGLLSEN
jgi:hypothetical protein